MSSNGNIENWGYYNHAMVPTIQPHEEVDVSVVENGSLWTGGGGICTMDYGLRLRL